MKLSRLILNPQNRDVARVVGDVQRLHQFVMAGFQFPEGSSARAQHAVLHRLEMDSRIGALTLYVQSDTAPDWSGVPKEALVALEPQPNPAVRDLIELLAISTGTLARFRLRANATRKIGTKTVDGRVQHGRRVPHRNDEACVEWLRRKGIAHGFELTPGTGEVSGLAITHDAPLRGHRVGSVISFEGVRFDGVLRIIDVEMFRAAATHGVGPAKAYGFGLLSFAPMRS